MVSTSVTFGLEADTADLAATGGTGAGEAGVGDEGGLGLDLTTIGPEDFGLATSPTLGFTIDRARGSTTLGLATAPTPGLDVTRRYRAETVGLDTTPTPGLDATLKTSLAFGHTAAVTVGLETVTSSHRITHRDALTGVFALDGEDIDGVFDHTEAIDGVVEREDR